MQLRKANTAGVLAASLLILNKSSWCSALVSMNGICDPRAVSSTFHLREKGLAEVVPGEVDDTDLLDAFGLAEAEAVDLVELLLFADVDDVTDPVATALAFRGLSADFCLLVENCFRSFCAWMVPCDSLWSDDPRTPRRSGSGGRRCGLVVSEELG